MKKASREQIKRDWQARQAEERKAGQDQAQFFKDTLMGGTEGIFGRRLMPGETPGFAPMMEPFERPAETVFGRMEEND